MMRRALNPRPRNSNALQFLATVLREGAGLFTFRGALDVLFDPGRQMHWSLLSHAGKAAYVRPAFSGRQT